jgi:hypothetical protein
MAPADAGHEQLADEAAPLDVLLADAAAGRCAGSRRTRRPPSSRSHWRDGR